MVAGVTYVNDSKATNVEATLTALNAYPERTHLILGGRDKASDYRPVARACARGLQGRVPHRGGDPAHRGGVRRGGGRRGGGASSGSRSPWATWSARWTRPRRIAEPGDVVLLAPACASFDQYKNFEERGEHFKSLVQRLQRESVVTATTVRRASRSAQAGGGSAPARQPAAAGRSVPGAGVAAGSKTGCPCRSTWSGSSRCVLLIVGLCMMLSVSTAVDRAGTSSATCGTRASRRRWAWSC